MNFLSRNLLFILVFLFVAVDVFLLAVIGESGIFDILGTTVTSFVRENVFLFNIVILCELIVIVVGAHIMFIKPVRSLKREISTFLTGNKKVGELLSDETLNPDVKYVIRFFNKSLEILKNFKDEFQAGKILKSEVELASEIQRHVLKKSKVKINSLDIVANTKSATEVGGDSYDIIEQGVNYYVYLWDVTGHGVASWFVMMIVNALISSFSKMLISSAEILAKTNEILKPRVKSNMLMTLLMVRWNEVEKKMYMTGAGHEYLLVYKHSQKKTYKIKSGGVALGMARDISRALKEVQIDIEEGDIIVMYTDGITEARNSNSPSSLMFGIDRLMETIEKTAVKTAQGVFNQITLELSRFMGYNHKQFDDITLIVIHHTGGKKVENDVPTEIPKEFITEWSWLDS